MDFEPYLKGLIENVVGKEDESLVDTLVGDVLQFSAWYKSKNLEEVQFDSGESLSDLTKGSDSLLLSRALKEYVRANTTPSDVDDVVRLCMDRIVNWSKWYPAWSELENFKSYMDAEQADSDIYADSDYGQGDNGVGNWFL